MRTLPLVASVCLALSASGALAQSSPSAEDILKSLTPKTLSGTTRGIRPAKPAAGVAGPDTGVQQAATGAPLRPAAPAAGGPSPTVLPVTPWPGQAGGQAGAEAAPSVNLTVQFATGSAQLTPAAVRTLDALGHALASQTLASYRFRIEGHTDTVGRHDTNVALSQARAAAVVSYLTSHFSVPADHLEAVGRGPDALLVPTPDQTAEPRNRRVQVVNLGA